VLVVELVVEMRHFVGVALRVKLVRGVEDEPLADLEHGCQQVHVLTVRQLEVLGTDGCALSELLRQRYPTQDVPHDLLLSSKELNQPARGDHRGRARKEERRNWGWKA
jgi:hypothetical protein